MLLDCCPKCSFSIALHRLDMVRSDALEIGAMSYCHACGFDLWDAPKVEPISYDGQVFALLIEASRA